MIPKCISCLQKHLASALSLGYEVVDGHSAGGNPDHRVDFSGEMIQAEKHASLIDRDMSLKIRNLRRILQGQRWRPTVHDLEKIRVMWYVSYSFDREEFEKISLSDAELAKKVVESLIEYGRYERSPEQSDVSSTCSCGLSRKVENVRNEVFSSPTSVIFCSDVQNSVQKESIRSMVIGINKIATVGSEFELFPLTFIERNRGMFSEVDGDVLCMWPGNVEIMRRTNALAFPSVVSGGSLSDSDRMFMEKHGVKSPKKFYKTPLYVTAEMLEDVCRKYRETTGSERIDDIYSIIRNFDNSPTFDNSRTIVSEEGSETSDATLFVISHK